VDKSAIDLILRVLDYIMTISCGYICNVFVFTCTVVVLNCFVMCGCVFMFGCVFCVGFVKCVFGNKYTSTLRLP